jgi:hypothetical protein
MMSVDNSNSAFAWEGARPRFESGELAQAERDAKVGCKGVRIGIAGGGEIYFCPTSGDVCYSYTLAVQPGVVTVNGALYASNYYTVSDIR